MHNGDHARRPQPRLADAADRPRQASAGAWRCALHVAVVDIEHDTKSYSIKYRDSQNLTPRDGMIHKNYNGWNLDKEIRTQVQVAAQPAMSHWSLMGA